MRFPPRIIRLAIVSACTFGFSGVIHAAAEIENVNAVGRLNYSYTSDVWGYQAADATSYAIVGLLEGYSIIDISTDPANPVEVDRFSGALSIWRDMKTWGDYLYVVNETWGGLDIVDIADPTNARFVRSWRGFDTAHNLYIDERGYAYIFGSNLADGGVRILDLADPENPVEVGAWENRYIHDGYAEDGILYASIIYSPSGLATIDVSDPSDPTEIGHTYYSGGSNHNAWLTVDGKYCLTTDEVTDGHVRVFDLEDMSSPEQVAEWESNEGRIVHNVVVRGDYAYAAYYTDGLRIIDLEDPTQPTAAGIYDPRRGGSNSMEGNWGVYPFSPSGIISFTDMTRGLYTCRFPAGEEVGSSMELDTPVVQPGGTVRLTGEVSNLQSDHARSVTAWVDVTLPNGVTFPNNPVAGPLTISLGAGESRSVEIRGAVPLVAPSGTYRLILRAGQKAFYPETFDTVTFDVAN